MNILSIETSCDETAVAIIKDGTTILSNVVFSQIDLFSAYGGVIPEVSARSHLESIIPVLHQAFKDANFLQLTPKFTTPRPDWSKIDAIAVTHTPGLLGSLLIGTLTARTLAILHNKPLYPVHHLKSHIYSTFLSAPKTPTNSLKPSTSNPHPNPTTISNSTSSNHLFSSTTDQPSSPTFPILALLVSGGHTQLIRMTSHTNFEIIGTTKDDAVGECFDKIAKILGLPYPGGPAISKLSQTGNRYKYSFPHPKVDHLDFSFSGLKTAVLRAVQKELNLPISYPSSDLKNHLAPTQIADFSASFEQTAIDILLEKTASALKLYPDTKSIIIAGGVSANQLLRAQAPRLFALADPTSTHTNIPQSTHSNTSQPTHTNTSQHTHTSISQSTPSNTSQSTHPNSNSTSLPIFFPAQSLSGDNAAMVGSAAYFEITHGKAPADPYALNIAPRSPIK